MVRKKKNQLEEEANLTPEEEVVVEPTEEAPQLPAEDPCYTVLKDSLKKLVAAAPTLESMRENPWLAIEWQKKVARLVS